MKTSISQTFQDKVVLITGATGFVGQPLVAKILTTIPQVKKVYLLIRSRTNVNGVTVSAEERLLERTERSLRGDGDGDEK